MSLQHSNKPMITSNWKNRLDLMQNLTKRNTSECVHLKIEQILKSSKNKEQTASELNKIITKNLTF